MRTRKICYRQKLNCIDTDRFDIIQFINNMIEPTLPITNRSIIINVDLINDQRIEVWSDIVAGKPLVVIGC